MSAFLFQVRTRRILRQYPSAVWQEFYSPIFNRGQVLTLGLAVVGAALVIQRGSAEEVEAELSGWYFAIRAFGIVVALWALVSLIRAPFLIVRRDNDLGTWHGNRFVYHEPYLVKVIRCKPTGKPEYFEFKWKHAEPACYVKYDVRLESGAPNLIKYGLFGEIVTGLSPLAHWPGTGGMSLPKDNRAVFGIEMDTQCLSTTARIYCRSFQVGDNDEQDGSTGKPTPFRYPPRGNDRP